MKKQTFEQEIFNKITKQSERTLIAELRREFYHETAVKKVQKKVQNKRSMSLEMFQYLYLFHPQTLIYLNKSIVNGSIEDLHKVILGKAENIRFFINNQFRESGIASSQLTNHIHKTNSSLEVVKKCPEILRMAAINGNPMLTPEFLENLYREEKSLLRYVNILSVEKWDFVEIVKKNKDLARIISEGYEFFKKFSDGTDNRYQVKRLFEGYVYHYLKNGGELEDYKFLPNISISGTKDESKKVIEGILESKDQQEVIKYLLKFNENSLFQLYVKQTGKNVFNKADALFWREFFIQLEKKFKKDTYPKDLSLINTLYYFYIQDEFKNIKDLSPIKETTFGIYFHLLHLLSKEIRDNDTLQNLEFTDKLIEHCLLNELPYPIRLYDTGNEMSKEDAFEFITKGIKRGSFDFKYSEESSFSIRLDDYISEVTTDKLDRDDFFEKITRISKNIRNIENAIGYQSKKIRKLAKIVMDDFEVLDEFSDTEEKEVAIKNLLIKETEKGKELFKETKFYELWRDC